jgi:outer membrane lipoprotein-sorting protein
MKKWILSAAFLLMASAAAFANNAVAEQIKQHAPQKVTCQFEQQKFLKGMAKPVVSSGKLYYQDGNMAMLYTQPAGDFLIINPSQFVMQTRGKKRELNIKTGSAFLTLKNTLVMCMQGNIQGIVTENGATLTYANNGGHEYTLTKELKKGERGYAKIVLLYDAKTYLITSMTLVEANGNYTVYTMKDANTTANIDGNLFKVPAK